MAVAGSSGREAAMTTDVMCPICRGGVLAREEGKLEQSGDSFLPTVRWRCALCEYTRYEPAPHARWQPGPAQEEPAVEAPAPHRRAA